MTDDQRDEINLNKKIIKYMIMFVNTLEHKKSRNVSHKCMI